VNNKSSSANKASWVVSERARHLADGEYATSWRPDPDEAAWVDFGAEIELAAIEVHWTKSSGRAYRVELSADGSSWSAIDFTPYYDGRQDLVVFSPRPVRHLRLTVADPGRAGIAELEVLPANSAPVTMEPEHAAALDGSSGSFAVIVAGEPFVLDLREPKDLAGVRFAWADQHAVNFAVQVSADAKDWHEVGRITSGNGGADSFYWPLRRARYLRVDISDASSPTGAHLREVLLRVNDKERTPLGAYERAAKRSRRGLYPTTSLGEQVYWTLLGTAMDTREALFDEFGVLEPVAGGPSIHPYVRLGGTLFSAHDAPTIEKSLLEGSLPIPTVAYQLPDVSVSIHGFAATGAVECPLCMRYAIRNTSDHVVTADLVLAIRPLQVNPDWQHGGLSPIREIEFRGSDLRVNNGNFARFGEEPTTAGTYEMVHDEDVIDHLFEMGPRVARSDREMLTGAARFEFRLEPGETYALDLRAPLSADDALRSAGTFADLLQETVENWRATLGPVAEGVPATVAHTCQSQIAYTLINQNGPALQPGSRNYDRTWMRDGCAHCLALMQAGILDVPRDYLLWFSARVQPDGLVPPILNPDGTVNTGHGSNLEFDAQGQFVFAVCEYIRRVPEDYEFRDTLYPIIVRAMSFLRELRERTTREHDPDSRFYGILAPSISHEGYSKPTHSYWDDFWGLRGWKDGAALAGEVGDTETEKWALAQYHLLLDSLRKSIARTIEDFGCNYVPSSADYGDFDPTSTSIAFYPCEVPEAIPTDFLSATYDRYLSDVRKRFDPSWDGRFTPYEIRNVHAFITLGRIDDALEILRYLLTCRRPAGWNHWAEVIIGDARYGDYIGDMPHTWIGCEFYSTIERLREKSIDLTPLALG
jgi:hypothetical protein